MKSARRKVGLALAGVLAVFAAGALSVQALNEPESGVPAPRITAKPPRGSSQTSARFAYADRRRGVSFQCSLDGSPFEHCASPTRYSILPGWHTFRVRAVRSARRREFSRPTSYTWLVDLQPPVPYIAAYPSTPTSASYATFAFTDGEPRVGFQCRVDAGAWRACVSPSSYTGLGVGQHDFQVRALDPPAAASPPAQFSWYVAAQPGPQPGGDLPPSPGPPPSPPTFSIGAVEGSGAPLYPGAAPQAIVLRIANPADAAIFVTSLSVTVAGGPPGCDPAANLSVVQSDVASLTPLRVPAHSSVTLPAQGRSAPTIQLLDLPVNQDACRNVSFPLSFTGSAHS
jgi:hypothetical protein